MNITLFLILSTLLSFSQQVFAEGSVGNGGGAWVCYHSAQKKKVHWIRSVDLYEGQKEFQLEIPLSVPKKNYHQIVEEKLSKLKKANIYLFKTFSPYIQSVYNKMVFVDSDLSPIDDSLYRLKPSQKECPQGHIEYVQLANFTHYGKILIQKTLWNHLKFHNINKAALIFHEGLYQYFREKHQHQNSVATRIVVAYLFAENITQDKMIRSIFEHMKRKNSKRFSFINVLNENTKVTGLDFHPTGKHFTLASHETIHFYDFKNYNNYLSSQFHVLSDSLHIQYNNSGNTIFLKNSGISPILNIKSQNDFLNLSGDKSLYDSLYNEINNHTIINFTLHPQKPLVVASIVPNKLIIFNYEKNEVIKELTYKGETITSLIISAKNNILITGSRNFDTDLIFKQKHYLRFWDLKNYSELSIKSKKRYAINALAINKSETLLAFSTDSKKIVLRNLKNHKEIILNPSEEGLSAGEDLSWSYHITFNPQGNLLASVNHLLGQSNKIFIWDLKNLSLLTELDPTYNNSASSIANDGETYIKFHPTKPYFFSGFSEGGLRAWRIIPSDSF